MIDRTRNEYVRLAGEIDSVLSDKTNPAIKAPISLRDAVCAFVEAERERGTTRQSVIQSVKGILKDAEHLASPTHAKADRSDSQLSKQLVDWCIEFHRLARIAPVEHRAEA